MAPLINDAELIELVLRDRACFYAPCNDVRTVIAFDRDHGQFVLIDEGWSGHQRIHHIWAHVELLNGKFLIHEDGTEEGLANTLIKAGIPRERIVLAFHEPAMRADTDFSVA